MEPEVRFCLTEDNVRIAYTMSGDGPPVLLCVDPIVSHVQLEWSHPVSSRFLQEYTRQNTLIRFDARGCGLSDRVIARTLDEAVLDAEAVVKRAGFPQLAVSANQSTAPGAI